MVRPAPLWSPRCGGGTASRTYPPAPSLQGRGVGVATGGSEWRWIAAFAAMTGEGLVGGGEVAGGGSDGRAAVD